MHHSEFTIGMEFTDEHGLNMCTDVGTNVIVGTRGHTTYCFTTCYVWEPSDGDGNYPECHPAEAATSPTGMNTGMFCRGRSFWTASGEWTCVDYGQAYVVAAMAPYSPGKGEECLFYPHELALCSLRPIKGE